MCDAFQVRATCHNSTIKNIMVIHFFLTRQLQECSRLNQMRTQHIISFCKFNKWCKVQNSSTWHSWKLARKFHPGCSWRWQWLPTLWHNCGGLACKQCLQLPVLSNGRFLVIASQIALNGCFLICRTCTRRFHLISGVSMGLIRKWLSEHCTLDPDFDLSVTPICKIAHMIQRSRNHEWSQEQHNLSIPHTLGVHQARCTCPCKC